MDNQQNQAGSPMPGDDIRNQNAGNTTGSTGLGNDATASGAGSTRKTGSTRSSGAQGASQNNGPSGQQGGQNQAGDQQSGNNMLDSALESGKKWIEDSGVLDSVNQLPQNVKEWGSRTLSRVGELSTTQKVVGGAILAAGLGWLALRKGKSSSSDSASYNYGKQRDTGSYGRRSYGYQAPDSSMSHKSSSGASSRSDSGAAYGNSGSRYGGSGASYGSNSNYGSGSSYNSGSGNTGIHSGSGRSDSGYGSTASSGDYGSRTSESSHRKDDDFRSIE